MLQVKKLTASALALAVIGAGLSACGSSASAGNGSGSPIVLGASVSATGALAQFYPQLKAGYDYAVNQVNARGGLEVGGSKRKVKLVLLDNQSNSTTAAQQIKTLVTADSANALLGAATPPITVPEAGVADSLRIPYVTSITPTLSWLAATKGQLTYAWDFFFNPMDAVRAEFATANLTHTNKKVALFTDNEADGLAWGKLVSALAPAAGYTVAMHATFPVGTTNYQSFVQQARADQADVMIALMDPPDGVALWKQIKALGYKPKVAFGEKMAASVAFPRAVGALANGTSAQGTWSSSEHLPGTSAIETALGKRFPDDLDLGVAVAAATNVQIVLDAIGKAGSTDPAAINRAIGQTDKTYTFAHIQFGKGGVATTPSLMMQWQGDNAVQLVPAVAGSKIQAPAAGLG